MLARPGNDASRARLEPERARHQATPSSLLRTRKWGHGIRAAAQRLAAMSSMSSSKHRSWLWQRGSAARRTRLPRNCNAPRAQSAARPRSERVVSLVQSAFHHFSGGAAAGRAVTRGCKRGSCRQRVLTAEGEERGVEEALLGELVPPRRNEKKTRLKCVCSRLLGVV